MRIGKRASRPFAKSDRLQVGCVGVFSCGTAVTAMCGSCESYVVESSCGPGDDSVIRDLCGPGPVAFTTVVVAFHHMFGVLVLRR